MPSQLFLTSLTVKCSATLFLFLVFLILFRHSRQTYFGYWTVAWLSLGLGQVALQIHQLQPDASGAWWLLATHHASLGATALLALFAREAFLHGRPVHRGAWLLLAPVCGLLAVAARGEGGTALDTTLARHLFLAVALWASGSVFWGLRSRDRKPGAGFLAVSFGLWGLQQAHYAAAQQLFGPYAVPSYLEWIGFVDAALALCVALGMILFALDDDRSRLLDANRKLEISEHRLKDLAMRDPLTGLFNRRHFDQVAAPLEAQARRVGFPVTVFVLDLNNFKEANDRDGHHRGDQILWAVAEFLRRETRASDLPFRWGGDEFLLLMTDLPAGEADEKARDLRRRWEQVRVEIGSDVTLAIGWSTLDPSGLEAAVRVADRCMYVDKRARSGGPGALPGLALPPSASAVNA